MEPIQDKKNFLMQLYSFDNQCKISEEKCKDNTLVKIFGKVAHKFVGKDTKSDLGIKYKGKVLSVIDQKTASLFLNLLQLQTKDNDKQDNRINYSGFVNCFNNKSNKYKEMFKDQIDLLETNEKDVSNKLGESNVVRYSEFIELEKQSNENFKGELGLLKKLEEK